MDSLLDSRQATEAELMAALQLARFEYDNATPGQKAEAKARFLTAIRNFKDFIMCGWP